MLDVLKVFEGIDIKINFIGVMCLFVIWILEDDLML